MGPQIPAAFWFESEPDVDLQSYTAANRKVWEETAPVHQASQMAGLMEAFADPAYLNLDETARQWLARVGVEGKSVAQLCCNNGRELISIQRLGAGRCTGFDISESFITQAEQLNAASHAACEFLACDVYAIPSGFDAQFDLIYISVGALGWLPNLAGFLGVCARLLRPGGALLVYEMHPILDMIEDAPALPPHLANSYFRTEPLVDDTGLDYYNGTQYAASPGYWFHHKMSDILQTCLDQGFILTGFAEYPHDVSNVFAYLEQAEARLPLSYVLSARLGEGN
jgi:ubiquinone/menaquinone biosynthesis C-methylase UbiE